MLDAAAEITDQYWLAASGFSQCDSNCLKALLGLSPDFVGYPWKYIAGEVVGHLLSDDADHPVSQAVMWVDGKMSRIDVGRAANAKNQGEK